MECPICFEVLSTDNNVAITECGHQFHTSCLLKSCLHGSNNYFCPLCRKELAKDESEEESASESASETASETSSEALEFSSEGNIPWPRNREVTLDDLVDRMRIRTSITQAARLARPAPPLSPPSSFTIKIKTNFNDLDPTAEEPHTPWFMLEVFENDNCRMSLVANLHNYYDPDETKFHVQMALVDKPPSLFFNLNFIELKIKFHISHVTCGLNACERRWVSKSLPIIFSEIRELPEARRYAF